MFICLFIIDLNKQLEGTIEWLPIAEHIANGSLATISTAEITDCSSDKLKEELQILQQYKTDLTGIFC